MRTPKAHRHRTPPKPGPKRQRPDTPPKGVGTLPPWYTGEDEETPR